jgi:hypothetical protein
VDHLDPRPLLWWRYPLPPYEPAHPVLSIEGRVAAAVGALKTHKMLLHED